MNMGNNGLAYSYNNSDFDIQTLMNIVGQNAMTMQSVIATIDETKRYAIETREQTGLIAEQVETYGSDIKNLKDRMCQYENNTEITNAQCVQMATAVSRRVYQLFPSVIDKKYRSTAFKRCYSEMQRFHGMGRPYRTTPKCMYKQVMDAIEAWLPVGGVDKLRDDVDKQTQADK